MPQNHEKLPEIIVFAGPNGSGKSTITKLAKVIEPYIKIKVSPAFSKAAGSMGHIPWSGVWGRSHQ